MDTRAFEAPNSRTDGRRSLIFLIVPAILFVVSLYARPETFADSGYGFLVLRSMLAGAPFNCFLSPDPLDIAKDVTTFQTWWSPGQYLAPGLFVWLGTDYGVALCLTALFATVAGVIGWIKVARSLNAPHFVLLIFVCGLTTFRYVTLPFRIYNGGEVLLFAAAPWSLYWLRLGMNRSALQCFALTLLSAVILFFAKLTGLIVFAANVLAIGGFAVAAQRRLSAPVLAMAAGSVVAALIFVEFWMSRGSVPAGTNGLSFNLAALWFPIAASAWSGVSGLDLMSRIFLYPSAPLLSNLEETSYVLGPLGLIVMVWTWIRLRNGPYRQTATFLAGIIALYAGMFIVNYVKGSTISYEERHFRYVGILFFLMALIMLDRTFGVRGRRLMTVGVAAFALYGLVSYGVGAYPQFTGRFYDPYSGTSQHIVSPAALAYLRSQMAEHNWPRAIAVIPSPEAAIALPKFRIIADQLDFTPLETIAQWKWAGRTDKIFVVVQDAMTQNGKADALLKCFIGYDAAAWQQVRLDGMTIYSQ